MPLLLLLMVAMVPMLLLLQWPWLMDCRAATAAAYGPCSGHAMAT
jgi:DMSO/TMAO reductase YedYZ heme-binding membrane subunit